MKYLSEKNCNKLLKCKILKCGSRSYRKFSFLNGFVLGIYGEIWNTNIPKWRTWQFSSRLHQQSSKIVFLVDIKTVKLITSVSCLRHVVILMKHLNGSKCRKSRLYFLLLPKSNSYSWQLATDQKRICRLIFKHRVKLHVWSYVYSTAITLVLQ